LVVSAFFSEGGSRISTRHTLLVSGSCYLSNRCSDTLIRIASLPSAGDESGN
jgi:hypothetical protein